MGWKEEKEQKGEKEEEKKAYLIFVASISSGASVTFF